jgi:hypothetical protein
MLSANYQIRHVDPSHYEAIIAICKLVYPTEMPCTVEEIGDHRQVFPQGQFCGARQTRVRTASVTSTSARKSRCHFARLSGAQGLRRPKNSCEQPGFLRIRSNDRFRRTGLGESSNSSL